MLTVKEEKILKYKIESLLNEYHAGKDIVAEIRQLALATETQLKAGLAAYKDEVIAAKETEKINLTNTADAVQDDIDDLN